MPVKTHETLGDALTRNAVDLRLARSTRRARLGAGTRDESRSTAAAAHDVGLPAVVPAVKYRNNAMKDSNENKNRKKNFLMFSVTGLTTSKFSIGSLTYGC